MIKQALANSESLHEPPASITFKKK